MNAHVADPTSEDRTAEGIRKILLLPSSYAPVLGGLQTVARALARHLSAGGHQVRVVTKRYPRALPAREVVDGVRVERWPLLRPSSALLRQARPDLFLASLYYGPLIRGRLERLLRSFRPDVVNVHFPDAQVPFVLGLRRRFGFRLVVSVHGHDVERFTGEAAGGEASQDLRALLAEADAVTACSRHLLDSACRLEPAVADKGTVIYNGIDPERFHDTTPYLHPRPYILAMGRLTWKKGFDLLLEALARLDAAAMDLLLAGGGEERAALEAQARRLGLAERVHFVGQARPDEVIRLLNGCRLLAIPSRIEPFGIVALEGLAAGKPVLATRVGGMAEFLAALCSAEPAGASPVTLVEPTADELAAGLRTRLAASDPPRPTSLSAHVRDEYSWQKVTRRYESVFTIAAQRLGQRWMNDE